MARNEIIIRSDKGGQRTKTSAVGNVKNIMQKQEGSGGSGVKSLARTLRTVRTLDTGGLGLFGGGKGGAGLVVAQELVKIVNKGIDIALDIGLAKTGDSVRHGNVKRIKGYVLNPIKYGIEATYGEWLREMAIKRENVKNEYYRNLTGNLMYGKQYGDKR